MSAFEKIVETSIFCFMLNTLTRTGKKCENMWIPRPSSNTCIEIVKIIPPLLKHWFQYKDGIKKVNRSFSLANQYTSITRWRNDSVGWLVVLGFNATLTAKVISWRSVTDVFPGFLTPVLTQLLFFPKPPTTFLSCFCRGGRRKYAGKKSLLNRGSNP